MRKVVSESIGSPKRRHEIATKAIMNGWASTPAGSIMFAAQNQAQSAMQATLGAELAKDVTLTSPLASGFVPFDLRQPSRLLYPVYSPSH